MTRPDQVLDPATIGRFQLLGCLQRGRDHVLFQAVDSGSGGKVTLKCGLPGLEGPDPESRLRREWECTRFMQHPGIPRAVELGHEEGIGAFLVFPHMEGRNLESLLESGIPLQLGLHFLVQLMHALDAAEAQGILHGDIRLENLWLQPSGQLSVLGFGAVGGDVPTPETERFDVALTAFRLMTGQGPWPSGRNGKPDVQGLALRFPHDMSPELQRVFEKALASEPGKRYASLHGFLSVLIAASPLEEDRLETLLAFMDGAPAPVEVATLLQVAEAKPAKPYRPRDTQPIPILEPVNGHRHEAAPAAHSGEAGGVKEPAGSADLLRGRQALEALLGDVPGLQEFAIFGRGGELESASRPCETLGDFAPAFFFDAADALLGSGGTAPAGAITLKSQRHGSIVLVRQGAFALTLLFKQGKSPKGLLEQLQALPPA